MKREAATLTVKTTTTSTLSIAWADVRAVLAEHYAAVLGMPVESLTVGLAGRIGYEQVYASDDLDDLRPALDGQQVMEILGLSPGRDVGAALEFLQQVRFDVGVVDRDTAVRLVSDWWAARPV